MAAVAAVASAVVAAASALPWVHSGDINRTGYALASALHRAGLTDIRIVYGLVLAWFALPLVAAGAWTTAAVRRFRTAAILAMLTGVLGMATGFAVLASHVETKAGPWISIVTGATALVSGFRLMHLGRQAT
jgi:hypothetical protein